MGRTRTDPSRQALRLFPEDAPSRRRLRQFLAYGRKVYDLGGLLDGVRDSRVSPRVPTAWVARLVFLIGLLRWRSFNDAEGRLRNDAEAGYALGLLQPLGGPPMSIDAAVYALRRVDVASVAAASVAVVRKAERNKAFRAGWVRAFRYVALDGWEVLSSRSRHCEACLSRKVRIGEETITEYYHRVVVAFLVDDNGGGEVVLGMEEVRSADVQAEQGEPHRGAEGELTASKRLVPWLRRTYGRWLDVLVVDALYACGPFLTVAQEEDFGVVVVLKKPTNEPLKEALVLFNDQRPQRVEGTRGNEQWALYSTPGLRTLSTYDGPIDVVRACITRAGAKSPSSTWCCGATGVARRLSPRQVIQVARGRWHIENTAFNQWTQHWNFDHVFTHGHAAILGLLWLFVLAFNLLQFFAYRHLSGWGRDRGSDTTCTLVRLIDEMAGDFARLTKPLDWSPG